MANDNISNHSERASQLQPNSSNISSQINDSHSIQVSAPRVKRRPTIPQIVDKVYEQVRKEFLIFLENFSSQGEDGEPDFIEQAATMAQNMTSTLYVSINDLISFNEELGTALIEEYYRFENAISKAAQNFVRNHFPEHLKTDSSEQEKKVFVGFTDIASVRRIRDIKTEQIGQMIAISGTVTRTSEVRPELLSAAFTCKECLVLNKDIAQQFVFTEPICCSNPNCENKVSWELELSESFFVDWQRVRLQEDADEIPAGSMPRHVDVVLRNEEVEKVKPGDKCIFSGSVIVVPNVFQMFGAVEQSKTGGRKPDNNFEGVMGIKALGVKPLSHKLVFLANNATLKHKELAASLEGQRDEQFDRETVLSELSEQEKHEILTMSEIPNIYERMAQSIAPEVFGHIEIKRGILLMLVGGVHKKTHDKIQLRGDINVCIVGDPSTAKSQFLKFVCDFIPRSVYTSGKASSAAGLTASVAKDPETGEFGIEAGALMLADNGVCCIDEFDKMDPLDQSAIHEAMEQQTISVTKAGINATLNARASILAAANPIYGRYDLSKSLKENIDISAAIMSRFDLFFVVTDVCDESTDLNMARHIVSRHQGKEQMSRPHFDKKQLRNYIRYARTITPQFSDEAQKLAVKLYVEMRQCDSAGSKSAYRFTVRQLESILRLSEAMARIELKDQILEKHVREASRLLKKSIIPIQNEDVDLEGEKGEEIAVNMGSEKQKTQTKSLSYEEYSRLSNLLIHRIRRVEKDSEDWNGMSEGDLMNWYLEQGADLGLFVGEEEAKEALEIARAVMNRLIKVDNVLIVLDEPELVTEENRAQRIIDVHPNFDPETNEIETNEAEFSTQQISNTQNSQTNVESMEDEDE